VVNGVFVGRRARIGSTNVTNTTGVFHIQPCTFSGTVRELAQTGELCVGVDDGNLDVGLRYDFNNYQPNNALNEGVNITNSPDLQLGRQFISETERQNIYLLGEHDFSANLTGFAEVLYYTAETFSSRAPQPLDSGLAFLIIPRTNYWNPFGPTGSPNRIAGLNTSDVPAAGLDVLLQNWRPTDLGPRFITTDTETYRVVTGLRGEVGNWDWESAFSISGNTTTDTESNRLSKTLLAAELARSTPDAINPFGGPNANTQEQWNRVRISSTNSGETELTTWDLRASNSEVFNTWAGAVGVAGGVEWRNESYLEDRDPRLDGTIIFDNTTVSGISDVVGVSPTRDSSGESNVYSAFAEALIPLNRGEGTFKNDLTLQLAARAEHFDNIEETILKPKVALSWFPVSAFNLRAAYSQGFRAPNLPQLSRGDVSRLNLGREDYYRLPVLPTDPSVNGAAYVADIRQSNPNLRSEDTETVVVGAVADLVPLFDQDWISDFRVSLDYWQFEQTDLVGVFGVNEALAFDALLRLQGSSNPNVVRADPTANDIAAFAAFNAANPTAQRAPAGQVLFVRDPYINLDKQTADGFDLGIATEFDFGDMGELTVDVETTYLQTLEVIRNDLLTSLAANPAFAGEFSFIEADRIRVDGNPQWRSTATFGWRLDDLRFGGSVRYISDFEDINADVDLNGDGVTEQFIVEETVRVNLFSEIRLPGFGAIDRTQVRLGVNNVFDEPPPLADESLGYRPDYHQLKGREFYVTLGLRF
jgi:outer membrane receptor protein involved in Fe transport